MLGIQGMIRFGGDGWGWEGLLCVIRWLRGFRG
jgi:hypothetical protein